MTWNLVEKLVIFQLLPLPNRNNLNNTKKLYVSKALIGSEMFCLCTIKSCKFVNLKPWPLFLQYRAG